LADELTAISQYMVHSEMCANWEYKRLHEAIEKRAIDEMKHADQLIERTLFLEGLPNLQNLGKLMIGEHTQEMLESDLRLEMDALPELREAIVYCESAKDFVSRDLFSQILNSEEEHVDWLETQLQLIGKVGVENYLQSQMKVA